MRQIENFMHSVLSAMKNDKFIIDDFRNAISEDLNIQVSIDDEYMWVFYAIKHYIEFRSNGIVYIVLLNSESNEYEYSYIDLNIEDKEDYFNFSVQNDPGALILNDIEILKTIKSLAHKILNEK